ncbi:Variant surface glycoprotein [Trypanosoma congolense IL3000]|uniref:Variant surface glycoprotein n=1 Tax=Trypanosoma congolense (strain IL3000) TaxID=1068625 RepID=F9W839_TRYCI|nr:Variant surface glycoprotein [Trypanosoma congolense IL3000]
MEWGMWRRLLSFLFFVGKGTLADGSNSVVFDKLCSIAGGVSTLMEKQKDSGAKTPLGQALYGEDGIVSFDKDGSVLTVYGCGFGLVGRSEYCSHMRGGVLARNGNGCFSHSLLGTFLCLCTNGKKGDKDLCGLKNVGDGAIWTGDINGGHEKSLLKKVWGEIKVQCIEKKKSTLSISEECENVENAVKKIKEQARQSTINGYVTLGGTSTDGICSGARPGDACVTYTGSGNAPDIPWVTKILTSIQSLKKSNSEQQTSHQNSNPPTPPGTGQSHHYPTAEEYPTDHSTDSDDKQEEESEKEHMQNGSQQDPFEASRQKRKKSSHKYTEEIMVTPTALLHKDDGSFLHQPSWLLSAVVIF